MLSLHQTAVTLATFRHILLENHDLSYGPSAPVTPAPHDADLSQNSSIYIVERPSDLHATCVQDAYKMRATKASPQCIP